MSLSSILHIAIKLKSGLSVCLSVCTFWHANSVPKSADVASNNTVICALRVACIYSPLNALGFLCICMYVYQAKHSACVTTCTQLCKYSTFIVLTSNNNINWITISFVSIIIQKHTNILSVVYWNINQYVVSSTTMSW